MPFPLSFSVAEVDGWWLVDATPVRAAELADLLTGATVVLGLATTSFLDEDYRQWPPSRIAAAQGVACGVHPLGALASGVVGLSEEALTLRAADLPRFLDGWSPYDLSLVDLPGTPTPELIDELAVAVGTARVGRPALAAVAGARLRFAGHDDCYATVESTSPAMPAAVLRRLLALLADAPEPDPGLAETLLAQGPHWVGRSAPRSRDEVAIGLTAMTAPWRLSQPLPDHTDHTATYDRTDRTWRLD